MNTGVIAGALRAPHEEGPRTDLPVAAANGNGTCGGLAGGFGAAGRLLDVAQVRHESLPLSSDLRWFVDLCGQVVQGGVYLIGGPPGGNKSTLARQIVLDLARQGHRSLMVLTEEPPTRLKAAILRMTADWPPEQVRHALSNIHVEGNLGDWSLLPGYFARHVLAPGGMYHDAKLIVIDSIQGQGIAASAGAKWRGLYEFASLARAAGVTVLMVSHLTKAGNTAGPKSTEHNADVVLALRKAGKGRHFGILKNRFSPELHRLFPLEVDPQQVMLRVSPRVQTVASVSRAYLPGVGLAELQAAVSLARWGQSAKVMAPGLPRREIEQLVMCIGRIEGLELDNDLDFSIQARLPQDRRYSSVLGLALSLALVGSLLQLPIPAHQLQLGEIDLCRNVRDLPAPLVNQLAQAIASGDLPLPLRPLVPPSAVCQLPSGPGIEVVACRRLDDAVLQTWSQLR